MYVWDSTNTMLSACNQDNVTHDSAGLGSEHTDLFGLTNAQLKFNSYEDLPYSFCIILKGKDHSMCL